MTVDQRPSTTAVVPGAQLDQQSSSSSDGGGPLEAYVKKHGAFSTEALSCMSLSGILFFLFISGSLTYTGNSVLEEVYAQDSNKVYTIHYLSIFIVLNLYANFILCMRFSPRFTAVNYPELPLISWKFCPDCQHQQPPRCHHCPVCQCCILKKDHHCFFIGTCVGESNQRYFVPLLGYSAFGLLLGAHVMVQYMSRTFYDFFSLDFYHYILPITFFEWILGNITFGTLLHVMLTAVSCVSGLAAVPYFAWHLYLMATNLTTHEATSATPKNNANNKYLANIRTVFGPYWLANFIIPMPWFNNKDALAVHSKIAL